MKKRKPVFKNRKTNRYNGIFNPERGDVELDREIVSSNEMTGSVPAAQEEYEEDAFDDYYM